MKMIFVTTEFEGFHRYQDAPEEVSFLRELHRHIFKVRVDIQVHHDDRELEFIIFKRYLNSILSDNNMLNHKSCEMICDDIHEIISDRYPNRSMIIEVSEDGENGSRCVYDI